jgi:HD-GYP domain-containing protein (c-di-GMP phosphodiesterase class II)
MQYAPLATVRNRITYGEPMQFNIRNADHTLLLARGQVVRDEDQMESLLERGAIVDMLELKGPRSEVLEAHVEQLPALWTLNIEKIGRTLRNAHLETAFAQALETASEPVLALIERDPDLAIFQVLRQESINKTGYGVSHSVHAAITALLVARRLGWPVPTVEKVFKASLTMNLSMLDLQGRLSLQVTPPTAQQRQTIRDHPLKSVEMLKAAGITDKEWLDGVAQHHESPDGKGYPAKLKEISDIASLLRRVDMYTAKLSARNNRAAVAANQAGRDLFMSEKGHPMTAALVKEFGIYPPGCFVLLTGGETGVVIKRGEGANTPIVAVLTSRTGEPLMEPVRRNTAMKEHAIVSVVSERTLKVRISPEKLVLLATQP